MNQLYEIVIEHADDSYIWVDLEQCGFCGYELPPVYDIDDTYECSCGLTREVPPWLRERMEEESYGKPDRDKGGRLDWGPPGRYRPFPARSGYPFDREAFPHE